MPIPSATSNQLLRDCTGNDIESWCCDSVDPPASAFSISQPLEHILNSRISYPDVEFDYQSPEYTAFGVLPDSTTAISFYESEFLENVPGEDIVGEWCRSYLPYPCRNHKCKAQSLPGEECESTTLQMSQQEYDLLPSIARRVTFATLIPTVEDPPFASCSNLPDPYPEIERGQRTTPKHNQHRIASAGLDFWPVYPEDRNAENQVYARWGVQNHIISDAIVEGGTEQFGADMEWNHNPRARVLSEEIFPPEQDKTPLDACNWAIASTDDNICSSPKEHTPAPDLNILVDSATCATDVTVQGQAEPDTLINPSRSKRDRACPCPWCQGVRPPNWGTERQSVWSGCSSANCRARPAPSDINQSNKSISEAELVVGPMDPLHDDSRLVHIDSNQGSDLQTTEKRRYDLLILLKTISPTIHGQMSRVRTLGIFKSIGSCEKDESVASAVRGRNSSEHEEFNPHPECPVCDEKGLAALWTSIVCSILTPNEMRPGLPDDALSNLACLLLQHVCTVDVCDLCARSLEETVDYAARNFKELSDCACFLELSLPLVVRLLRCKSTLATEEMLFDRCMNWVDHAHLKPHEINELLTSFHFALIPRSMQEQVAAHPVANRADSFHHLLKESAASRSIESDTVFRDRRREILFDVSDLFADYAASLGHSRSAQAPFYFLSGGFAWALEVRLSSHSSDTRHGLSGCIRLLRSDGAKGAAHKRASHQLKEIFANFRLRVYHCCGKSGTARLSGKTERMRGEFLRDKGEVGYSRLLSCQDVNKIMRHNTSLYVSVEMESVKAKFGRSTVSVNSHLRNADWRCSQKTESCRRTGVNGAVAGSPCSNR